MFRRKLFLIPPIVLVFLQSCGTLFDMAGKGAKTECLSLITETRTIRCGCEDKQIYSITLYQNKNAKEQFGAKKNHFLLTPTSTHFTLPVSKDSLDNGFFQIEIHLTNTHWRESYYIDIKPGDFANLKQINSRYFSH